MKPGAFPHLPAESWDLFLQDRLPAASTARLEEHLASCRACRTALEATDPSRVFRRLAALRVRDEQWDGFWDGIRERLAEPEEPARPAAISRAPRAGTWALVAGAAVTAIAAAGLVLLFERGPEPGTTVAANTCPPTVAALSLSARECAVLFGSPIDAPGSPEVVFVPTLELRGL